MDAQTAYELNEMNRRFYVSQASAFSRTRQNGWPGWQRCLEAMGFLGGVQQLSVLDVACGNLRFENWMQSALPMAELSFVAIDNCRELLPDVLPCTTTFIEGDLVEGALELRGSIELCDLAVSFGFLHHIPSADARRSLVDQLVGCVRIDGFVAVSFWRFADEPGLAARAKKSTAEALSARAFNNKAPLRLDEGDYLLGFDQSEGVYRFCHSFTTLEIDELLDGMTASCTVVDRFRADGRTGTLNEYVILKRTG